MTDVSDGLVADLGHIARDIGELERNAEVARVLHVPGQAAAAAADPRPPARRRRVGAG